MSSVTFDKGEIEIINYWASKCVAREPYCGQCESPRRVKCDELKRRIAGFNGVLNGHEETDE